MSNGQGFSSNSNRGALEFLSFHCWFVFRIRSYYTIVYCLLVTPRSSSSIYFLPLNSGNKFHSSNRDCSMLILATQIWLWFTRKSDYRSNSNEAASGIVFKYLFFAPARHVVSCRHVNRNGLSIAVCERISDSIGQEGPSANNQQTNAPPPLV